MSSGYVGNSNIRNQIQAKGLTAIGNTEKEIAKKLNVSSTMTQQQLIELQQLTQSYGNTITMMSTMLKNLSDTDKEVIRNS